MTHQRVSFGEVPCFGPEAELDRSANTRRRKPLRYRLGLIAFLVCLPIVATGGMYLSLHTTGRLSDAGTAAAWIAGIVFAGYFADPILASVTHWFRRKRIHLVK